MEIRLIIKNNQITAEATDQYTGPDAWVVAPPEYVLGSYILPDSLRVVYQVSRSTGILALKRHYLDEDGELVEAEEMESTTGFSLYDRVVAFRDTLPDCLDRDRLDIALTSTLAWKRQSQTVAFMAMVIPLSDDQIDRLFLWADKQEDSF